MVIARIIFGGLLIAPLFKVAYPFTSDWHIFYSAATNSLVEGQNYHNPIWTVLLLKPFAYFGSLNGYCIMMGLTTSSILVISKKISGKYIAGILAIISVPFLRMMIHGQPEIFPLWGVFSSSFLLSPLLLLVKPQSAFFAILGRIKSNPTIMLTTFVLAISALYTIEFGNVNKFNQNISLWPYGLIIGLPLLIKSLRDGDVLIGAIATYFVAPYVITHSVVVPLFAFYLRWPKWSIPMWIFVWYVLTSNS